jgi:uncharacterized Fe-S center protein
METSERSKVFFFPYDRGRAFLKGLRALFSEVANVVSPGDSVAIKVHMGEYGGSTYLRPPMVRRICDLVKEAGGKPFVTDTTTLYPLGRFTASQYLATAAYNGFTEDSMGAPVVIADREQGTDGEWVNIPRQVSGCPLDRIKVARKIVDADCLIAVTHAKGHALAGFGGSIKNLAMGCVVKESKGAQHRANRPLIDISKCTGCGQCVEECRFGALSVVDDKMVREDEKCMNCSHCLYLCTEGVYSLPPKAREKLQVSVAHSTAAILSRFDGKAAFINFIQDVTRLCDCATPSGPPVVPDIGILASTDVVAVDAASLDLIARSNPLGRFADIVSTDILGKINNTDSRIQIRTAQELGVGNMAYELIEEK